MSQAISRILVVEDQPVPREVLAKILARNGYEVRAVASVEEALAIGGTFCPHVLLADWMLQDDLSGLQVAESLRALQPDLSVIFLTGLPTDKLAAEAAHVQPCVFIEKPCDFEELLNHIRSLAPRPD